MKKWWKRSKNRILSFSMALLIGVTSVLPSMSVEASSGSSDVLFDANGDGQFTLDEVLNPFKLMSYVFTTCGYWLKEGTQELVEDIQEYRDWLALGPAVVVGSIDDSGFVTISDEVWDKAREIADLIRGRDGFTQYPAMPVDRMYYYGQTGYSYNATNLSNFLGEKYDMYFKPGVAVRSTGTNNFLFCNPQNFYGQTSGGDPNYIDKFATYVYIAEDGWIFPYIYDGNTTFTKALCSNWYHTLGKFGSSSMSSESESCRDSQTAGRTALCKTSNFLGIMGYSVVVFSSATNALNYLKFDRTFFDGSEYGVRPKVSLEAINGGEWWTLNNYYYQSLLEQLQSMGSMSNEDSQKVINEFTQEVLSSMEFIEGENVQQTTFLHRIYELLKEWLPKIGNKDTNVDVDVDVEIEDSMNDFEADSSTQGDVLDSLKGQNKVDKPDIDSTSDLVDSNIDVEAVGEYGTLLSGLTSNQYVIRYIVIALSIALISYIFFGKR